MSELKNDRYLKALFTRTSGYDPRMDDAPSGALFA